MQQQPGEADPCGRRGEAAPRCCRDGPTAGGQTVPAVLTADLPRLCPPRVCAQLSRALPECPLRFRESLWLFRFWEGEGLICLYCVCDFCFRVGFLLVCLLVCFFLFCSQTPIPSPPCLLRQTVASAHRLSPLPFQFLSTLESRDPH